MNTNINATRQNQIYIVSNLFLGAVGFFMVWVYLALSIEERFDLSKPAIGAVVGSIVLFTSSLSWFGGMIGDRFGQVKMLRFGILLYVPVVLTMAITKSLFMIMLMISAMGLIRAMTTPSMKALCLMADDGSGRMFRFHYLCIAASFATVGTIAMLWKPEHHTDLFYLAAVIMGLTSALTFILPQTFIYEQDDREVDYKHQQPLPIFSIALIIGFGGSILILMSQFETNFPLHLVDVFGKVRGVEIYSIKIILGSIFGFGFAVIYDQITVKWPSLKSGAIVIYGIFAITLGAAFMYKGSAAGWVYFGVALFISAEVMLFPMMDSLASRFMNGKNRGRFMGLLEIRQLALFAGPVIGGLLLEISPIALIIFHFFAIMFLGMCYLFLSRIE